MRFYYISLFSLILLGLIYVFGTMFLVWTGLIGVGPLQALDMHSLLSKFSAVLSVRSPVLIPKNAL